MFRVGKGMSGAECGDGGYVSKCPIKAFELTRMDTLPPQGNEWVMVWSTF